MPVDANVDDERTREIEDLRARLHEAEQTIRAIRSGEVDAFVMSKSQGYRVFTIQEFEERLQVEATLRTNEERYRALLNHVPALLFVYDRETLAYLSVSDAAVATYGYSREEFLAMTIADICPPEDVAAFLSMLSSSPGIELEFRGPWRHRKKNRKIIDVEITTCGVELAGHSACIILAKDVTDQRRAQQELRRTSNLLQAVADGTPDAMFVKDRQGCYLLFNRAAEEFVGRSSADVLGKNDILLFGEEDGRHVMQHDRRVMESNRSQTAEERLTAAGVTRTFHATKAPLRNEFGVAVGLIGISRDVTERKLTEQRLIEGEERFRTLIEATASIVWNTPESGEFEAEQPSWTSYTGQNFEQLKGWGWLNAVHPDDRAETTNVWTKAVRERTTYRVEHQLRRADGIYQDMVVRAVPIITSTGEIREWIGVHTDVTAQRNVERQLIESNRLFAETLNAVSDLFVAFDRDWNYTYLNAKAAEFIGREPEELIGKNVWDVFRIEADDRFRTELEQAADLQELRRFEVYYKVLDRWYDHRVYPHRHGMSLFSTDITEQKRTQKTLEINEAKLAEALRQARMGYWDRNLLTGELDWSAELYTLFGIDPTTFGRKYEFFLRLVHPDDQQAVRDRIERAITESESFEHTYRIVVGAETRAIYEVGHVITADDGRPIQVFGTAQDITERWHADESTRLLNRAIQSVTQGILITDASQPDDPIVYVSPGFERITGYSAADCIGINCRFLQGKETDPAAIDRLRDAIRDEKACSVELLNYRKDGKPFWNDLSISPVRNPAGRLTHFVGVQTEVTDRRSLEEQYRHAQKMEAFGQLAGGVAHDFNNLLTIISGCCEFLGDIVAADPPARELVDEITQASERAADLTRQLLAFSRKQVIAPRKLSLNMAIADTEKMLRRIIGEDVLLDVRLAANLGEIKADSGQIHQVLINLAVNARDAMPQGGRLTIGTRNCDTAEFAPPENREPNPDWVLLTVSDTGCGMSPEVMTRIFEPFFTTKELGKGTGLGLATVFGIVKQNEGHIQVSSEVGRGTSFEIYFPRLVVAKVEAPATSTLGTLPKGRETVLIVEDEEGVRILTRRVLNACGYRVLEAGDGAAALKVAAAHEGPIELMITDVVMPGLSGPAVAEQLRQVRPQALVLYVSGYTDNEVVRNGVHQQNMHFLQKPFSSSALATKVRAILDAQR